MSAFSQPEATEVRLWCLQQRSAGSPHLRGWMSGGPSVQRTVNSNGRDTHTLSGQDEKKKEYRPVSSQCFASASRSKSSPMGMPHMLRFSVSARRVVVQRTRQRRTQAWSNADA